MALIWRYVTYEGVAAIGQTVAPRSAKGGGIDLKRPQQPGQLRLAQGLAPVALVPPAGAVRRQGRNDPPGAQAIGVLRGEQLPDCGQRRDCNSLLMATAA